MKRTLVRRLAIAAAVPALALGGTLAGAVPASAADFTFRAHLDGRSEVPGPGDRDGMGTARITVNPSADRVCFVIRTENIGLPAIGAHIHEGQPNEAGPVVVALANPDQSGIARGCVTVEHALARDIQRHPRDYYVNIHTKAFPAGAVRGQLHR